MDKRRARVRACLVSAFTKALLILTVLLCTIPRGVGETVSREQPEGAARDQVVEVTFLVNAGFLLRSGGSAILIDAFVDEPNSVYGSLPPAVYQKMLAGDPPFGSIQLALVSHFHRDHFQPVAAGSFLSKHPETVLVSSPEVLQAVRDKYAEHDQIEDQLREAWPEEADTVSLIHSGIRVEFIRLRHEGSGFYPAQSLAHIIHLGGKRFLHLGDAEMDSGQYGPYDLRSRKIDVALVPYWFLQSESTGAFIEEHIAADKLIATHFPPTPTQPELIATVSGRFPDVIILETPMKSFEIR